MIGRSGRSTLGDGPGNRARRSLVRASTWLVVLATSVGPGSSSARGAGGLRPVGSEFQINSYTTGIQANAQVAPLGSSGFVVVWGSGGSFGSDQDGSIQARLMAPDGTPRVPEFQVNDYTTWLQDSAVVAAASDGRFLVAWRSLGSFGSDASYSSVQARLFDAQGQPLTDEFQVNTTTLGSQYEPDIVATPTDEFVVVWSSASSAGSDSSLSSIQGQRFAGDATPLGGEFQINTSTTSWQWEPTVDAGAEGDFVVVWQSYFSPGSDTSFESVLGQRFDPDGLPVGPEFQVNSYTTGRQYYPDVNVSADGGFLVAWCSNGSFGDDDSELSIQARRFDSGGVPTGPEFQLNSYTTGYQRDPDLALSDDGSFVVAWSSIGSLGDDDDSYSAQVRRFEADDSAPEAEFQANVSTSQEQYSTNVRRLDSGRYLVTWMSQESSGTDTSWTSIQGRYFVIDLFSDGFESGDTSAWSAAVP